MRPPHLLFVVGTTATGKSDLAVQIAEQLTPAPELINCDSVAFFEKVQIGAAKPGADLLSRAVHHLVGHVSAPHRYTAGDFRRDALKIIEREPARDYVVVGGSGFYSQALEKGMYDVADPNQQMQEQLLKEAEGDGIRKLYQELKSRDPETKIQPADHYRTLRALEILRNAPDKTMAEIKANFEKTLPKNPFTSSKIGLFRPRDILRQKVTERTQKMLRDGLIGEVERLRAEGLQAWSPMQSVGYKEVQSFLNGTLVKEDLEPLIVTSTMQLAKQQMTWLKRDPTTKWFDSDREWNEALKRGVELASPS
jgi:tRNA dimethylallyltransferase